jgi:hypothetical protein
MAFRPGPVTDIRLLSSQTVPRRHAGATVFMLTTCSRHILRQQYNYIRISKGSGKPLHSIGLCYYGFESESAYNPGISTKRTFIEFVR